MFRDILIAVAIIVVLVLVALAFSPPSPAAADTLHDFFYDPPSRTFSRVRYRGRRGYRAPVEREWQPDDGNRRPICVDRYVEVTSTEHTTEENAMEAARKLWMAATSWREGAQYLDLKIAKDYLYHCGPSNPMDTASGRINEAVNQAMGKDGQNVRCIIRARPCRAILEQAEGHR